MRKRAQRVKLAGASRLEGGLNGAQGVNVGQRVAVSHGDAITTWKGRAQVGQGVNLARLGLSGLLPDRSKVVPVDSSCTRRASASWALGSVVLINTHPILRADMRAGQSPAS